jgi:hypothetical protein
LFFFVDLSGGAGAFGPAVIRERVSHRRSRLAQTTLVDTAESDTTSIA